MKLTYLNSQQPVDFWEMLTLLFVGLRLAHQIDWSWFLVLSPYIAIFVLRILIITSIKMWNKSNGY